MALYAEGGHVAKRARVDYSTSPTPITTLQLTAGTTPQNIAAAAATAGILSQQYIEQQLNRRSHEPEKPNHILLFTGIISRNLCFCFLLQLNNKLLKRIDL